MNEKQIRHMVDRFLAWNLPQNFNPDGGVSFDGGVSVAPRGSWPTGTNLFDATQSEAMVRHMVEGLPADEMSRLLADRVVALTAANADLHSRLDELRRVHAPRPERRIYGDGVGLPDVARCWPRSETASDRLAAHSDRIARAPGSGGFSDPAGGG